MEPQNKLLPDLPIEREASTHEVPEQPSKKADLKTDGIIAIFLLATGFIFSDSLMTGTLGIGTGIAFIALICACLVYFKRIKQRPSRASLPYFLTLLLYAINCMAYENTGMKPFLILILLVLCPYWVFIAFEKNKLGKGSHAVITDVLNATVLLPARSLFPILSSSKSVSTRRKEILACVAGITVSIPLLFVVSSLLLEADSNFNALVSSFAHQFLDYIPQIFQQLALTLGITWYLCAMVFGIQGASASDIRSYQLKAGVPTSFSASILILLNSLYVFFLLVQIQSIGTAYTAAEGFSYSQYAREGFFELCFVSFINLCVYAALYTLSKQKKTITRVLLQFLCLNTLCIICTAILKMGLYMQQYGLTLLRLYTTCFMVLLFATFLLLSIAQFKPFAIAKTLFVVYLSGCLILSFANAPGIVASVNVNRYLQGSLASFDMTQYGDFPYESLPHLLFLHDNTEDMQVKSDVADFVKDLRAEIAEKGTSPFFRKTFQQIHSEKLLETNDSIGMATLTE